MGIVNCTDDSFSGDGILNLEQAIAYSLSQHEAGADLLDIGGESSRPGATPLTATEELSRISPLISKLATNPEIILSVDTYKPEVASWALQNGAHIINDIHGGRDPEMLELISEHKAGYVIMHMQGEPTTMQTTPTYTNIIAELITFFEERVALAKKAGVLPEQIVLDPGIGFGKTLEHNLEILRNLDTLRGALPYPWLIGTSRKRFIGTLTGKEKPEERVLGTAASVALAIGSKASIVRVHDVSEMRDVVDVADGIINGINRLG
jgi:dihydropteroate synthase